MLRADPTTGVVSFDPKNTYRGGPNDDVSSVARDATRAAGGTVEHHPCRYLYLQVTVIDSQPVNDARATPHHASVTLPGLTDDRPGDASAPLRPELTVFVTSGRAPPRDRPSP